MNEVNILTEKEYQKLSLNFRRVASRFLNCPFQDYTDCLKRFLLFIKESPIINEFVQNNNLEEFDIGQAIKKRSSFQIHIANT